MIFDLTISFADFIQTKINWSVLALSSKEGATLDELWHEWMRIYTKIIIRSPQPVAPGPHVAL